MTRETFTLETMQALGQAIRESEGGLVAVDGYYLFKVSEAVAEEDAMLRDLIINDLWKRGQVHQGDAVALLQRLGMTPQEAIAATDAVRAGD